jgi:hypothetical protein
MDLVRKIADQNVRHAFIMLASNLGEQPPMPLGQGPPVSLGTAPHLGAVARRHTLDCSSTHSNRVRPRSHRERPDHHPHLRCSSRWSQAEIPYTRIGSLLDSSCHNIWCDRHLLTADQIPPVVPTGVNRIPSTHVRSATYGPTVSRIREVK